jgi:hypothetical protein
MSYIQTNLSVVNFFCYTKKGDCSLLQLTYLKTVNRADRQTDNGLDGYYRGIRFKGRQEQETTCLTSWCFPDNRIAIIWSILRYLLWNLESLHASIFYSTLFVWWEETRLILTKQHKDIFRQQEPTIRQNDFLLEWCVEHSICVLVYWTILVTQRRMTGWTRVTTIKNI